MLLGLARASRASSSLDDAGSRAAPAGRASARGSRRSARRRARSASMSFSAASALPSRLADDPDDLVERVEDLREALEDVDAPLAARPARARARRVTTSQAEVEEVREHRLQVEPLRARRPRGSPSGTRQVRLTWKLRLRAACACRGTPSPAAGRRPSSARARCARRRSTRRARRAACGSFLRDDHVGDPLDERALCRRAYGIDVMTICGRRRVLPLLDLPLAAQPERAPARSRRSRAAPSCVVEELAAGREVRALDVLEQVALVASSRSSISATQRVARPRRGCAAGCWSPCRRRCRCEPLTSRLREARRQHDRLVGRAVVVRAEVDRALLELGEQLASRAARARPRCSAWPPARRRRASRSCRARRRAARAARSPAPCGPSPRRSPTSPCGWYLPITSPTTRRALAVLGVGRRGAGRACIA